MSNYKATWTIDVEIEIDIEADTAQEAWQKAEEINPIFEIEKEGLTIKDYITDRFLYKIYGEKEGQTYYEDEI